MKKAFLICLGLLFFYQCQSSSSLESSIVFTVTNFDHANNQMEVTFSLTNSSQEVWEGGQWSLHWNQFSGSLQPESLPQGMTIIPTKNSQYWVLNSHTDQTVNPGETLIFSAIQSGIMTRLVMGPVGFFIRNAKTGSLFDLNPQIRWKNAQGLEGLQIPSAAERYAQYEGLNTLPKDSLYWVVPTPQQLKLTQDSRERPQSLFIDYGPFEAESEFLSQRIKRGLQLTLSTKEAAEARIELIKEASLAEEAYHLAITSEDIKIHASGFKGVFYAFSSLHQILLTAEREQKRLPLLEISDKPRFKSRGFMMDLARNFYPKEKILQVLDYMAFYKLNLLDLRLSDDEGWRLEIPGLPELTSIGGQRGYTEKEEDRLFPMYGSGSGIKPSPGSGFLSKEDYIEILKEARLRHIEVVPQISFPSHARAAIVAMKNRYENYKAKGEEARANEYRLHDPNDQSEYTSAQLFHDNTICICDPASERFFVKVFNEIKAMYSEADLPMKIFNIGADELPYGVWRKSPLCADYLKSHPEIDFYQGLYDENVKRINKLISEGGAQTAGWEDVLLVHSEKSQSEIEVNQKLKNLDFIPYVWNNTWGEGREDMIYRLNNLGFKAIMSNSTAFYFDMTDDKDMENVGLNWSGFVNYKDSWGTEPLNVFANKVKLKQLGISEAEVANKESIRPDAISNFLGMQSQLWTETAMEEAFFDRMLMPNMIVFAQRAWGAKESWLEKATAAKQQPLMDQSWNLFVNTLGQRHLPLLQNLFGFIAFDLPKPGGIVEEGELKVRQQFPGLRIHYNLNGSEPTTEDPLYTTPVKIPNASNITLRVFDTKGRGGNSIQLY